MPGLPTFARPTIITIPSSSSHLFKAPFVGLVTIVPPLLICSVAAYKCLRGCMDRGASEFLEAHAPDGEISDSAQVIW